MGFIHRCDENGMSVTLIRELGAERDNAERELVEAGVPLPITCRSAWAANLWRSDPWFLVVQNSSGSACAGVGIEKTRTRALPGHTILTVRRFGERIPPQASKAALEALALLAKSEPYILRLTVHLFSREQHPGTQESLRKLGFRQVQPPGSYRHTLVIDLRPTEDQIFAAFSESGRNKIRKTARKSLRSEVITDPAYAGRLTELQNEALQRTGGHFASENWLGILKMSKEHPELSQVFGLFAGEDKTPQNMIAFGWVCNHGDHAEYRAAGSTRRPDLKLPYGYLIAWDMIRWAKSTGAQWFDMGGVTLGEADEAALEGISNFKRSFSREVVEVGAEWVLEPSPFRARMADLVSNCAQQIRKWRRKQA